MPLNGLVDDPIIGSYISSNQDSLTFEQDFPLFKGLGKNQNSDLNLHER